MALPGSSAAGSVVLLHKGDGCVCHWSTKSENGAWCKDPADYHGLEHAQSIQQLWWTGAKEVYGSF